MADQNHFNCRCWRCFIQDNFTAVVLLVLTILTIFVTVGLMHEDAISDKYVTWLEGLVLVFANALALAMRAAQSHPQSPDAHPPAVAAPAVVPDNPPRQPAPIDTLDA